MALNQMGLGFLFTAKDQASTVMGRIERSFGRLNGSARSLAREGLVQGALGAGAMVLGLGALRKEFGMAEEAGRFEQGLQDVRAITRGTIEDLKMMKDATLGASFGTQFDPNQVVTGLRDIAQAGFNAADSVALLKPALNMASGSRGELGIDKSGALLTQTLKAFRLTVDQAGPTVDKLLAISDSSAIAIRELPSLIGHVSRGAASYKASLDEALIATGLARDIMGNIELASTGVSMVFERLMDSKNQKRLATIGVAAVDAAGKFRPLLDVLLDIQNSALFGNKTEAQQAELILKSFGHRALSATNAIFSQLKSGIRTHNNELLKGVDAINYMRGRQANAGGTAARNIEAHLNSLPGQLAILRASIHQARVLIGLELVPIFRPLVDGFVKYLGILMEKWQALPAETKSMFSKMAVGVSALTIAFGGLLSLVGGITVLSALFSSLGITFGGLLAGIAPIVVSVLALAAASYVAYQAYKTNFGGFAIFVGSAFHDVKLAVQGLIQLFTKGAFSGSVMKEMDKAGNGGVRNFVITLYMWGSRIQQFFRGLWDGLKDRVGPLENAFMFLLEAFSKLGTALGLTVGDADDNALAFDRFGETGRDLGRVLSFMAENGLKLVTYAVSMLTGVIRVAQMYWGMFGTSAGASIDIIRGALQLLFGALSMDGSMFWRGFVNTTFGAVKFIITAIYGMIGTIAAAIDWLNARLNIQTNLAGVVADEKNRTLKGMNESQQFWINYVKDSPPTETPLKDLVPQDSAGNKAGAPPPSVAAATSTAQVDLLAKALAGALMSKKDGSTQASSGQQPQQINFNVDGRRFMSVMVDPQKEAVSDSYGAVSSGGPE